jgi:hypothetical protein
MHNIITGKEGLHNPNIATMNYPKKSGLKVCVAKAAAKSRESV